MRKGNCGILFLCQGVTDMMCVIPAAVVFLFKNKKHPDAIRVFFHKIF